MCLAGGSKARGLYPPLSRCDSWHRLPSPPEGLAAAAAGLTPAVCSARTRSLLCFPQAADLPGKAPVPPPREVTPGTAGWLVSPGCALSYAPLGPAQVTHVRVSCFPAERSLKTVLVPSFPSSFALLLSLLPFLPSTQSGLAHRRCSTGVSDSQCRRGLKARYFPLFV